MPTIKPAQQLAEIRKMISAENVGVVLNSLRKLMHGEKLGPAQLNIVGDIAQRLLDFESGLNSIRIAVLGSYTTQPILTAVRCALVSEGILADIYEAPFGSYVQEILSSESGLYVFKPEIVIIAPDAISIQNLSGEPASKEDVGEALEKEVGIWKGLWEVLDARLGKPILQHLYEAPAEEYLGIADKKVEWSAFIFIQKMNSSLMEAAPSSVRWVDVECLASRVGRDNWYDSRLYNHGKYGFSPKYLAEYTTFLTSALRGVIGKTKKALILDLDNTLWGGVIGDDGLNGIHLGQDTVEGEAYKTFCRYIKGLGQRGVILGICSKNEYSVASEVFVKHPHMPLCLDDFSIITCNWNDKASNLLNIANELNIDISTIVFVDDNPAECELIRQSLPDVFTVQMDGDPSLFVKKLDYLHLFDSQAFSQEDIGRSKSYQSNAKVKKMMVAGHNLNSYLLSLEMKSKIKLADSTELTRLFQMEMKTNQFNLSTRRLSEEQIALKMKSEGAIVLSVYMKDCFSDYGLVSYVAFNVVNNRFIISDWLMSCRVFSRTLEHFIFNYIVQLAKDKKIKYIETRFVPTSKNLILVDLFAKLGFNCLGYAPEGPWQYEVLPVNKPLKCFITD